MDNYKYEYFYFLSAFAKSGSAEYTLKQMTTLEIVLFVVMFLWLISISTSKGGIEINYAMLAEEVKDRMRFDNTTYDYDEFQPEDEDSKKIKK